MLAGKLECYGNPRRTVKHDISEKKLSVNMLYLMGLWLYASRQLAIGWRGGAHQPTDLYLGAFQHEGRTLTGLYAYSSIVIRPVRILHQIELICVK